MRKTLLTLVTLLALGGLFAGSWFVTGMLRGGEIAPDTPATTIAADAVDGVIASGSTQPTGAVSAAEAGDLVFPLPRNLADLDRTLPLLMGRFGANSVAATRVFTYASIAWHDTANPAGAATFIAPSAAGQGSEQGMLAAGAVIVELLDNEQVADLVEAWEGDLSNESAAVVSSVVAFADADGYDATADVTAPSYEGPLAWKAGGYRDGAPVGYEPGYGQVKTVKLDLAMCPVAPAPRTAIEAERATLDGVDRDIAAPVVARPERFALLSYLYINANLPESQKLQMSRIGQTSTVMLHDALIATWRANWENGIAAPIDLFADGDTLVTSSYPSYPSWTEVAVAATETYVKGILQKDVTVEEMVDFISGRSGIDTNYAGLLGELTDDIANARSSTHHWNADRDAGAKLGTCIAGESLKLLGK